MNFIMNLSNEHDNQLFESSLRDALIAASVNYFASFISGLVIFAVLGYMATMENVSISDVATEGKPDDLIFNHLIVI